MEQTDERALRIAEKQKMTEERVNYKVEKFGFSTQFQEIKKQGFTESRFILKALRKCKGDVLQAIELLKTFAAKDQENKSKEKEATKTDEDQSLHREKKWQKHIKNRSDVEQAQRKEHRCRKEDREPREPRKRKEDREPRNEEEEAKQSSEKKWKKYLKRKDHEEDSELITSTTAGEEQKDRKSEFKARKLEKIVENFPQFVEFNQLMKELGFVDDKKNFSALKKHSGDQDKAKAHLMRKRILEELVLCKTLNKGQFKRVYLDCNNCFYLEPSFLKKVFQGNFKEIEEQIATLMKVFQANYGNNVEIVLVFDDSKLLKDSQSVKLFYSKDFSMITALPDFDTADNAFIALAGTEDLKSFETTLFITSDRMLQARLIEKNAKHIMGSKTFFNLMKDEVVGKKDYNAIVDV